MFKRILSRTVFSFLFVFLINVNVWSQNSIRTADEFFEEIGGKYDTINDYTADIVMKMSGTELTGTLAYKYPNKIRIDFDSPVDQVLVVNEEKLILFLPRQSVTMVQDLTANAAAGGGANLASRDGFRLLRKGYRIAYLTSPAAEALDDVDKTPVVKLKLDWRSAEEGFRTIEIAVDENLLIRRISGTTRDADFISIDYQNMRLNQNIPDARFDYEAPPAGHIENDFIYDTQGSSSEAEVQE